jgi:UDP-N-acetylglucosamine 1-carboxyvinyltransferase
LFIIKRRVNDMLKKLEIKGSIPLKGEVKIGGAKNAALPALAASLLTEEEVIIKNLPEVKDVDTMLRVLEYLGVKYEKENGDTVRLKAGIPSGDMAPYELVKQMRASVLVLGPLTARYNEALVSLPGGCAIGVRPINLHIDGLSRLGAEVEIDHGYVHSKSKGLKGTEIVLDHVTVTGTENLLMASVLAEGTTILSNCAVEPEVTDLAEMLNSMGAKIGGVGSRDLTIEGVKKLKGIEYSIIPDRIETGTYIIAGLITKGNITITNCEPGHSQALINKLVEGNAKIEAGDDYIKVLESPELCGIDIKTAPYPGFPTDMQAQFTALMTQAEGSSVVTELIFENRFMHVQELIRLGANITIDGHTAIVKGPTPLEGAEVMATDLRASASLILAGLAAKNTTIVDRVYHLDRGYEKICRKLGGLGARIRRIE